MLNNDPLAGPGPSGPADFGTPVSATVGRTDGILTEGSSGLGATTGDIFVESSSDTGIGAGAWFKVAGLSGGGCWSAGGEEARPTIGAVPVAADPVDCAESWLEMGGGDELVGGVMGLGGWVGLVDPILSNSLACVWPKDRVSERLKSAGVV